MPIAIDRGRRSFLKTLSAAGAAGIAGFGRDLLAVVGAGANVQEFGRFQNAGADEVPLGPEWAAHDDQSSVWRPHCPGAADWQQAEEDGSTRVLHKKTGDQRSEENGAFSDRLNKRRFGSALTAVESPPETRTLRLGKLASLCVSPQYVAEELLRAERFTDVQYVGDNLSSSGVPGGQAMGAGQFDVSMNFAAPLVLALDAGAPIVLLAGVHAGCFELFAAEGIRSIGDLKGRKVTVPGAGSIPHVFLSSIATSVGLNPDKDIDWAMLPAADGKKLLAGGKVDAMLAFPPDSQELRARRVGRMILNSAVDRPWSQYFCCLVAGNREFVRKHPVAAKRAVRAILKASEICAAEPDRATKAYMKQGYTPNPEFARQAVKELPFGRWREYNPEETVRFYALRLREAGMVKGAPQKLIAHGTDWRFLNELKKELKT